MGIKVDTRQPPAFQAGEILKEIYEEGGEKTFVLEKFDQFSLFLLSVFVG